VPLRFESVGKCSRLGLGNRSNGNQFLNIFDVGSCYSITKIFYVHEHKKDPENEV
jgi:hypothetical protein